MNGEQMGAKEYRDTVAQFMADNYDFAWTLLAESKKGFMPVGTVFGVQSGPVIMIGDIVWFPWASNRNKVEASVNFITQLRDKPMILYTKDKDFFVHIARHGVLRHVGKIHIPEQVSLFETRA